jgi:hypothetical protein
MLTIIHLQLYTNVITVPLWKVLLLYKIKFETRTRSFKTVFKFSYVSTAFTVLMDFSEVFFKSNVTTKTVIFFNT